MRPWLQRRASSGEQASPAEMTVRRWGRPVGLELGEHRGGERHGGDALVIQQRAQGLGGEQLRLRGEAEAGAGDEGGEHLADGGVEAEAGELEDAAEGMVAVSARGLEGGVGQAPVGEEGALGPAGGARGVDDVGEVRSVGVRVEVRLGLALEARGVLVEEEDEAASVEQVLERGVGEEEGGEGVGGDEVQTLGGQGGVEGEPGATGLEDGEHGDDEVDGALEAEGDEDLGADTEAAQVTGELIGAGVELGVGEQLVAEAEGRGVRGEASVGLDEAVDGELGERARRAAPLTEHLEALGVRRAVTRPPGAPRAGRPAPRGRCASARAAAAWPGRGSGAHRARAAAAPCPCRG